MSFVSFAAFVLAAVALLGSPGPGIAALVAVGRDKGVARGLPFYGALQLGLAIAAALSAAGLASALEAAPTLGLVLTALATVYLLWLAWSIASAPIQGEAIGQSQGKLLNVGSGFLLGVANPKAYIAFASLMGSFTLMADRMANAVTKWTICVAVMVIVDLAWLWAGAQIGSVKLNARSERLMNIAMGLAIAVACAVALA